MNLQSFFRSRTREKRAEVLDQAISAWKRGESSTTSHQRLSPGARSRILANLDRAEAARPLADLFVPRGRVALAGLVPVLLAGALFFAQFGLLDSSGGRDGIRVSKHGDQVVFTIANGKDYHDVTRSLVPDRFDTSHAVQVAHGERFVDSLESDARLIFYRID